MNILVLGSPRALEDTQRKFGAAHHYQQIAGRENMPGALPAADVVFDFELADEPAGRALYKNAATPVFVHAVNQSLLAVTGGNREFTFFGFNGWPGCLEQPLLETSCLSDTHRPLLESVCATLGTDFRVVDDRVGLVTPRIIAMIINEAFYAVQDQTATRANIDRAMQLGTHYPHGPFAWCQRIGTAHVYRLLDALYADTHDERYKIAPLLKKEFLLETATPL